MQADILTSITKLMHKHTSLRESALRDASASLSSQLVDGQHALDKFKLNHGSGVSALLGGGKELGARMGAKAGDARKVREGASKALAGLEGSVSKGVEDVRGVVGRKAQEYEARVEEASQALDLASTGTFERLEKGRRARVEDVQVLREEGVRGLEHLGAALAEGGRAVDEAVSGIVATVSVSFSNSLFPAVCLWVYSSTGIIPRCIDGSVPPLSGRAARESVAHCALTGDTCCCRRPAYWPDAQEAQVGVRGRVGGRQRPRHCAQEIPRQVPAPCCC